MSKKTSKPVIGIIPSYHTEQENFYLNSGYLSCLSDSGGIGLMLPSVAQKEDAVRIASRCDAFLLAGGPDIHPSRYGEAVDPACGRIDRSRDFMEEAVFEYALKRTRPVLGICRGLQVINVFLGADLYQDLPSQYPGHSVNHFQTQPYEICTHDVIIEKDSPFFELAGADYANVNSMHHQAIKNLSNDLSCMAKSSDGVIEAAYMPSMPFVWGVQWHPEHLFHKEITRRLFARFITEAGRCKN